MLRLKYSTLAAVIPLAILASDIIVVINTFIGVSNGSTALVLALNMITACFLLALAKKTAWKNEIPKLPRLVLAALLTWSCITLARGALVATDYWAWKSLATNHLFMYLMPLGIVIGLNSAYFKRTYSTILLVALPIAFLTIPLTLTLFNEIFQRATLPVFMLLLTLPFISRSWKFFVIFVAIISVALDLSYRTNVLRIMVATSLAMLFMFRLRPTLMALNAAWLISLLVPLLLLGLGLSGKYNLFRDGLTFDAAVTVIEGGVARESAISADTRTFLYDEVLTSMKKRGSSFIMGQGAGTGYESIYFSESIVGANGRGGSEVGFLNTLLYSGVIGVILYAAMLFIAALYAFNRSNNDLCKAFGLFLLFKWVTFFIEDIPRMDLNFFCIWIIIGLCLSKSFRQLNNAQVRSIFRVKHPSTLFRQVQAT